MKKTFYIIAGVYLILYCTLLNQYMFPSYKNVVVSWYIPLIFLVPLCIPSVMKLMDKISNVRLWTIIAIIVFVLCSVLQLLRLEGFWISLPTIGLIFMAIVLVMNITEGKMSSGKSLLLGCGCVLVSRAVAEFIYKTGYLIYRFPDGIHNYYIDLHLIAIGLCVGIAILFKLHNNLLHPNIAFMAGISILGLLVLAWTSGGFITVHFYSDQEFLNPFISRSTMAICFLLPLTLFIKRKGGNK